MNEAKITKLTPEQEAIIPIVKHKWIEIGLDTKAGNKEAVIAAINSLYFNLGLQPPATIEWLDPKTMLRQSTSIDFTYYPREDSTRNANYYNCKIIYSIKEAIDIFLDKNLQTNLRKLIVKPVNEIVHKPLWSSIMWKVKDNAEQDFEASLEDIYYQSLDESHFIHFYDYYLSNYLFGNFAYYDYLDCIGLPIPNIKEWLILAQHSWLWQLYRDEVKVVLRPEINLDKEQRLHNIGKPAVSFKNYDLYYYHGQGLSKEYGKLEPKDWQIKWFAISPIHYIKNIFIKETQIEEQELNRKIELEQEKILAKIPAYKASYNRAVYSTTRIDREKASQAIKAAYSLAQKNNYFAPQGLPNIHFCSSPLAACQHVKYLSEKGMIIKPMAGYLYDCRLRLIHYIESQLMSQVQTKLSKLIFAQGKNPILENLQSLFEQESIKFNRSSNRASDEHSMDIIFDYRIFIWNSTLAYYNELFQFYLTELNGTLNSQFHERISIFKALVDNCGWLFCFGNLCIVCDRPTKIFLDDRQRFHNIGSPAIEFSDGYHIYAHHGEVISQQYGKLAPSQWQIEWIVQESSDRLKQLLVKVIGLERIFRECDVERIDTNEQYELFNVQITSSSCNSSFNLLKDRNTKEKNSDLTAVNSDKNTITTALNSRPWKKIPF